jgi:integrase
MTTSTQKWVKDSLLPGLYQRVTDKSAVWAVKARRRGFKSVVTVTIGPTSLFSVAKARSAAKGILAQLAAGNHPNDQKRQEHALEQQAKAEERARAVTLSEALEDFLAIGDRKAKTVKDCRETITRNFADWLNRPLNSISNRDVQERFASIIQRVSDARKALNERQRLEGKSLTTFRNKPGLGEAQRSFRYLGAIFNMVMADDINGKPVLDRNPVASLKAKRLTKTLMPRERYLMPGERENLLHELSIVSHPEYQGGLKQDDADFTYLILMTGLRVEEARQLRWKNINFDECIFTAEDTKNGLNHTLPMTPAVERLFRSRFAKIGVKTPWVFPSPSNPQQCSSMSRTFERLQAVTGITFTAHDLRRTVATIASEMGYDLERIGAVLNHKKSGVTARYIQTTIGSLRETLQAVEDEVLLATAPT